MFHPMCQKMKKNLELEVAANSTDRHIQKKLHMKQDPHFHEIMHQFDPWHITKSISK